MSSKFSKYEDIDEKIKSGQITQAQLLIKTRITKVKDINDKIILAELARRVGLSEHALKLLYREVREFGNAEPLQKFEYALSLMKLGYYSESRELLASPDLKFEKKRDFYSAFSDIYQWNYKSAEEKLKRYRQNELSDYDRLVVDVNLLACAVLTSAALPKIETLITEAKRLKAFRLLANIYELMAQAKLYTGKANEVQAALVQAEKILSTEDSIDGFFIKKWKVLSELKNNPNNKKIVDKVIAARRQAYAKSYWEAARDIDFHLGIWNRNRSVMPHLYFGTPFDCYRARLEEYYKKSVSKTEKYLWRVNQVARPTMQLDLDSGALTDVNNGRLINLGIKGNNQALNTLRALSTDFYRPIRVSSLAEFLYFGEHYNPFSTNNKVYQSVYRLKITLLKNKIPLQVLDHEGYRLQASDSLGVLISLNYPDRVLPIDLLNKYFKQSNFSSEEAAVLLGISKRSAIEILNNLLGDKKLLKSGNGKNIRYHVVKN